jgi:hypothetical protein
MMSFRGSRLSGTRLPLGTVWHLETLAEAKGRRVLYLTQSPQILKALRELALVESAESSNRIEGVTVERDRLRPLVLRNARPRDRSEEEIVGYRKALGWVHTTHEKIGVEPETISRQDREDRGPPRHRVRSRSGNCGAGWLFVPTSRFPSSDLLDTEQGTAAVMRLNRGP